MKKLCISLLLVCLAVFCAGCTRMTATAESVGDGSLDPSVYAPYTPYGLTVEGSRLYYDGKLVRRFEDQTPGKSFSTKAVGYYDASGAVDVAAVRNGDHALTGLEVVKNANAPEDAYAAFGLELKEGAYYYQGKQVRLLWDSRNREASPAQMQQPGLDQLSNWDAGGVIDVYAVRDFSQKDENGYGALTGLRIASDEESRAIDRYFSGLDDRPSESA